MKNMYKMHLNGDLTHFYKVDIGFHTFKGVQRLFGFARPKLEVFYEKTGM